MQTGVTKLISVLERMHDTIPNEDLNSMVLVYQKMKSDLITEC